MLEMLNKLKEDGIRVDLIMRMPIFWLSGLMILFVVIAGAVANNWLGSIPFLNIMFGWFIGVLFGFKLLLSRIVNIDKDDADG